LYPSSSSFIRKADRREVSTFSLTATIIVDKSFLRIQVIAYISTTDHRSRSVPIFALSFLSLSLFLSSSRTFEGRVHAPGRWTVDGSSRSSKYGSIAREAEPASPCSRIAIRARFRFPLQHRSRRIRRSAGLMGSGFRDNRGGLSSRPHA